jgi:hypothetical protein
VQIAKDPAFATDVKTIFNSNVHNSMGLGVGRDKPYYETRYGRLFPCNGAIGQYVRGHSGGRMRSGPEAFIEIEVHGAALDPAKGDKAWEDKRPGG